MQPDPIHYGTEAKDILEVQIERMNAEILDVDKMDVRTILGSMQAIGKASNATADIARQRHNFDLSFRKKCPIIVVEIFSCFSETDLFRRCL